MSHFTLGVVNVGGGECRGGECRTIDPGLVQSMQVHFLLVLRLLRIQQDRCGKGPTNSFGDEGLFSCLLRFY